MPFLICEYATFYVSNRTSFEVNALVVGVTNVACAVPNIVLNFLVVNAFLRKKKLRKGSNAILLSLSITDLLSGFFIQPLLAMAIFKLLVAPPDDYPCWIVISTSIGGYILACISLVTVSFISLERYIAIFHPFYYGRKMSSRVIQRICALLWVIPAAIVIGLVLAKQHDAFFWFNGVFIVTVYVWNIAIYVRISRQVYKVRQELIRMQKRFACGEAVPSQSKVTQVAGSIIVALLLCFLPQVLSSLLRIIWKHRFVLEYVEYWSTTMALINPCLNPLFYCYYNSEIRKEVFFILKYIKKERKVNPRQVNSHFNGLADEKNTSNSTNLTSLPTAS